MDRYCTAVFEMHDFTWSYEQSLAHQKHYAGMYFNEQQLKGQIENRFRAWKHMIDEINRRKLPFFSLKKYKFCKTSRKYPIKAVIDKLGSDYFTCGLSYLIAYAIFKEYDAIDLYGGNVEKNTEWSHQRPAIAYWLGYAQGQGMEVTITGTLNRPLVCMDNKLYGFSMMQQERGYPAIVKSQGTEIPIIVESHEPKNPVHIEENIKKGGRIVAGPIAQVG